MQTSTNTTTSQLTQLKDWYLYLQLEGELDILVIIDLYT